MAASNRRSSSHKPQPRRAQKDTSRLSPPPPSPLFKETASRLALSDAQIEHLRTYVETLGKWQPKLNLIGPSTWDDVWDRHVVDSLQCLDYLPDMTAPSGPQNADKAIFESADRFPRGAADIGTGAGFPGIVVAIATGQPVTLIEADHRKAAFQLAVKTATQAPITVLSRRVEALPVQPLDLLFARAFAPMPRLLDWCAPLIDSQTQLLLHKGRSAPEEIAAAQQTHHFETESFPSLIDSDSVILRLRNIRPAR